MKKRALNSAIIYAQRQYIKHAYKRKTREFYRVNPALKCTLPASDQRSAKDYWSRFGFSIDPDWHATYATIDGHDNRFVPEDVYYSLLEPALNALEHAPSYSDKNAYQHLFADVPVPQTLLRRIGGVFYSASGDQLSESEAVKRLVAAAPGDFISKPSIRSGGGVGLTVFSCLAAASSDASAEHIVRQVFSGTSADIIVQARLAQHETLAALHPTSLNTLKVMSIRDDSGEPYVSCLLRAGANGAFSDNGSSGGVCCAVEADGALRGPWLDHYCRTYQTHPTTGVGFDTRVPGFDAVRALVKRMHARLPYFRIATFDIAIAPDATPVFIEVNLEGQDIQWHQWHNGPLFGDRTEWALSLAAKRRPYMSSKAARFIFRLQG